MSRELDRTGPSRERVPFDRPVTLKYRLFKDFIREVSCNISLGGMFVKTTDPRPAGAELEFSIELADGFSLIGGRGEVAWVRPGDEGPERPAGMGIRFVELEGDSRQLVQQIVEERRSKGREVFDLVREAPPPAEPSPPKAGAPRPPTGGRDTPAPPAEIAPERSADPPAASSPGKVAQEAAAAPATASGSSSPPAGEPSAARTAAPAATTPKPDTTPRSARGIVEPGSPPGSPSKAPAARGAFRRKKPPASGLLRVAGLILASALVGGLAVFLAYTYYFQPEIDALERRLDDLIALEQPRLAEVAPETGEEAAAPSAPVSPPADVRTTVEAWADAWSAQQVDEYLAFYAPDFRPPSGLDRDAWRAQREERLLRPRALEVSLVAVDVVEVGADRADVRFVQSYRSERFSDRVRKTLVMTRRDGSWKILEERVERAVGGR